MADLIAPDALDRVHRRVEDLLGPIDAWQVCVHGPDDGCGCRKPEPGLVFAAAKALGVRSAQCVVVGDIGSDMTAAQAAGARSVLVPTAVTVPAEITAAPRVELDLASAADEVPIRVERLLTMTQ